MDEHCSSFVTCSSYVRTCGWGGSLLSFGSLWQIARARPFLFRLVGRKVFVESVFVSILGSPGGHTHEIARVRAATARDVRDDLRACLYRQAIRHREEEEEEEEGEEEEEDEEEGEGEEVLYKKDLSKALGCRHLACNVPREMAKEVETKSSAEAFVKMKKVSSLLPREFFPFTW